MVTCIPFWTKHNGPPYLNKHSLTVCNGMEHIIYLYYLANIIPTWGSVNILKIDLINFVRIENYKVLVLRLAPLLNQPNKTYDWIWSPNSSVCQITAVPVELHWSFAKVGCRSSTHCFNWTLKLVGFSTSRTFFKECYRALTRAVTNILIIFHLDRLLGWVVFSYSVEK